MQFEVFIPAATGQDAVTLQVAADNWLEALRSGLTQLGVKDAQGLRFSCDIQPDETILVTDFNRRCVYRLRELNGAAEVAPSAPSPLPQADEGGAPTMVLGAVARGVTLDVTLDDVPNFRAEAATVPLKSEPAPVGATIMAPGGAALAAQPSTPSPVGATLAAPAALAVKLPSEPPRAEPVPPREPKATTPEPAAAEARPAGIGQTIAAPGGILPQKATAQPAAPTPVGATLAAATAALIAEVVPAPKVEPAPPAAKVEAQPPKVEPPTSLSRPPAGAIPTPDPWPAVEDVVTPRARVTSTAIAKSLGDEIPTPEPAAAAAVAPKTVVMEAVDIEEIRRRADEARQRAEQRPAAPLDEPEPVASGDPERFKATMVIPADDPPAPAPAPAPEPAPAPSAAQPARASRSGQFEPAPPPRTGEFPAADGADESILEDIFLDIYDLFEPSMTMEGAVGFIMNLASTHIKSEGAALVFARPDGTGLYVADARAPQTDAARQLHIPMGAGLVGLCVREGVPLNFDARKSERSLEGDPATKLGIATIQNILCAPIQHQGRVYGCVELINRKGRKAFSDVEKSALLYIGQQYGAFIHQQITAN